MLTVGGRVLEIEHLNRAMRWYHFRYNLPENRTCFANLSSSEQEIVIDQAFSIQDESVRKPYNG